MAYKVIGGIFIDTTFTEVIKGTEQHFGPFDTYEEARRMWHRHTFTQLLDNCYHRLSVIKIEEPIQGAEILRRKTRPDND